VKPISFVRKSDSAIINRHLGFFGSLSAHLFGEPFYDLTSPSDEFHGVVLLTECFPFVTGRKIDLEAIAGYVPIKRQFFAILAVIHPTTSPVSHNFDFVLHGVSSLPWVNNDAARRKLHDNANNCKLASEIIRHYLSGK
jgi:hypothetical protein